VVLPQITLSHNFQEF
jgi:hypothetical protein